MSIFSFIPLFGDLERSKKVATESANLYNLDPADGSQRSTRTKQEDPDEEKLLWSSHPSWLKDIWFIFLTISLVGIVTAGFYLLFWIGYQFDIIGEGEISFLWWPWIVVWFFGLLSIFLRRLITRRTEYLLTNQRLIFKTGLIERPEISAYLYDVQNVQPQPFELIVTLRMDFLIETQDTDFKTRKWVWVGNGRALEKHLAKYVRKETQKMPFGHGRGKI